MTQFTYTIKAHPTLYSGVRFRSRLEARWAAFFDRLDWRWHYEPFDLEGWSPDFVLYGEDREILCEVKPVSHFRKPWSPELSETREKMCKAHLPGGLILGLGPIEHHLWGTPGCVEDPPVTILGMACHTDPRALVWEKKHPGETAPGKHRYYAYGAEFIGHSKYTLDFGEFLERPFCAQLGRYPDLDENSYDRVLTEEARMCVYEAWQDAGNIVQWRASSRSSLFV